VRGTQGIKEAEYTVGGKKLRVAVASGLGNARQVLEDIKGGAHYDFVEVMACPGGCINGGGQPYVHDEIRNSQDLKALRAKALYKYDSESEVRRSHENAAVNVLYKEFFEKPNSHIAHELLHTTYTERPKY
jgi:iron only hydrogenase large subunit-like protein